MILTLTLALALAACEREVDEPPAQATPPERGSTPEPAPASPRPPRPVTSWASWPVEDVDPRAWYGWRIDTVSGAFVRTPGLTFHVDPDALVLAIAEGTVEAARVLDDGSTELVVRHGDVEARYRPLRRPLVYPSMHLVRGMALGVARGPELELLASKDGAPINPLELLGPRAIE